MKSTVKCWTCACLVLISTSYLWAMEGLDKYADKQTTVAHVAAQHNLVDRLKKIYRTQSEILMSVDKKGMQPIHHAAVAGQLEALTFLCDVYPELADAPGFNGWQPVHYAALTGKIVVLRRLAELGADMSALTLAGKTARDFAIEFGRDATADYLANLEFTSSKNGCGGSAQK